MENTNQDAMLHQQPVTYQSDTGGPLQIPDQSRMMGDEATENMETMIGNNFTDMEPSDGAHDASTSVGNNDGNLPDPEEIELEDITVPLDDEESGDESQEDLTVYDE